MEEYHQNHDAMESNGFDINENEGVFKKWRSYNGTKRMELFLMYQQMRKTGIEFASRKITKQAKVGKTYAIQFIKDMESNPEATVASLDQKKNQEQVLPECKSLCSVDEFALV